MVCPECEGAAAPWVTVDIKPFSVVGHEIFDDWDARWDWDGLPPGRAQEVTDQRARRGAATRRYLMQLYDGPLGDVAYSDDQSSSNEWDIDDHEGCDGGSCDWWD
jgi:hypothetical protein